MFFKGGNYEDTRRYEGTVI